MRSKQESVEEFRRLLKEGSIQSAYRAILSYMMELRTHFENSLGARAVSGLYQGYMDITYFALFPPALRRRNLKIAVLFNYDAFRFEVWLAGRNRGVQRQYWKLFKDAQWPGYRVATPAPNVDSILECDLASDFDLDDPDALTATIDKKTAAFIARIEGFLSGDQTLEPRKRSTPPRARSSNRD
jgi:hypothetical protein